MNPLSQAQVASYFDEGYVQVSGLIPSDVVDRAVVAMQSYLGPEPELDDGFTTDVIVPDADLLACYTQELCTAAAQLAGEDPYALPAFRRPARAFGINLFPVERDWGWTAPHIEGMKEFSTFRGGHRLGSIIYLNDVVPHGGGTVLWPGSHRKAEIMARAEPDRYGRLGTLNADIQEELGEAIEIPARKGDVMFFHGFCVHAKPLNVSSTVRMAMVHKW